MSIPDDQFFPPDSSPGAPAPAPTPSPAAAQSVAPASPDPAAPAPAASEGPASSPAKPESSSMTAAEVANTISELKNRGETDAQITSYLESQHVDQATLNTAIHIYQKSKQTETPKPEGLAAPEKPASDPTILSLKDLNDAVSLQTQADQKKSGALSGINQAQDKISPGKKDGIKVIPPALAFLTGTLAALGSNHLSRDKKYTEAQTNKHGLRQMGIAGTVTGLTSGLTDFLSQWAVNKGDLTQTDIGEVLTATALGIGGGAISANRGHQSNLLKLEKLHLGDIAKTHVPAFQALTRNEELSTALGKMVGNNANKATQVTDGLEALKEINRTVVPRVNRGTSPITLDTGNTGAVISSLEALRAQVVNRTYLNRGNKIQDLKQINTALGVVRPLHLHLIT